MRFCYHCLFDVISLDIITVFIVIIIVTFIISADETTGICLTVCLIVSFKNKQTNKNNLKSYQEISIKFLGNVDNGPRTD